ncbi:MAG: transposase [Bacillota bacterium]
MAADIFGISGMAMLEKLSLDVDVTPDAIVALAKGKLRKKHAELVGASYGRIDRHHKFILRSLLDQLSFLNDTLQKLETLIGEKITPFQEVVALLDTIPGVDLHVAVAIIAEIGVDMSVFPTERHLSSWAGLCPEIMWQPQTNYLPNCQNTALLSQTSLTGWGQGSRLKMVSDMFTKPGKAEPVTAMTLSFSKREKKTAR